MTPAFQWIVSGVERPNLDYQQLELWLAQVAKAHNRTLHSLNYIFCDDEEILRVNRAFLNHDYYTDIITFDNCLGSLLRGDLYISLDTVRSNAEGLGVDYAKELRRVIVHGVLHLCGINDKGPGEREIMERHEDEALAMLSNMLD
ncbi:MAG: rRNA maturation RNase YbeY [Muribaculaceae bacterium]|nr:rRNA maturation RNase YbeY [Muribaculaceae bacterium]